MKGAYAKPATVIPSTAKYNEICGGVGLSVIISPEEREKTDVLVAMSMSITKYHGYHRSRRQRWPRGSFEYMNYVDWIYGYCVIRVVEIAQWKIEKGNKNRQIACANRARAESFKNTISAISPSRVLLPFQDQSESSGVNVTELTLRSCGVKTISHGKALAFVRTIYIGRYCSIT